MTIFHDRNATWLVSKSLSCKDKHLSWMQSFGERRSSAHFVWARAERHPSSHFWAQKKPDGFFYDRNATWLVRQTFELDERLNDRFGLKFSSLRLTVFNRWRCLTIFPLDIKASVYHCTMQWRKLLRNDGNCIMIHEVSKM